MLKNDIPVVEEFELLPTGKQHVSFSELSDWVTCSWRHKLAHVLKIDLGEPSHFLDFGTACHASCQNFLDTRVMDTTIATDYIKEAWAKTDFESKEGKLANLATCIKHAEEILNEIPEWMEKTFPNWKPIKAEHLLYQKIDNFPHAFKGFIDAIIETEVLVRGKPKKIIWLLDWKTAVWGWNREKKQDPHRKRQLIYYKKFWAQETNTPLKDIKCGFILLKRTVAKGQHCELFPVSVGDESIRKSLVVINSMLSNVKAGKALKNRYNCTYCVYKDTEHCV